jgi:hypothetical protein
VLLPPEEETNPEVLRLAAKYESDLPWCATPRNATRAWSPA